MIRYPAFVIYVDYVYSHRIQFIFWKLPANIDGGDYEFLNCDGQQFHQYQQNKQSPITSTHLTLKKNTTTYVLQVLAWDRHKDVAGLNQLMGSQPLDNWISKGSICTYTNDKKNLHRFTPNQKDHILSQKWMTI